MEQYNWRQRFEPFYGKEYCMMITMDLEMLRDEKFQRNSFQFEEGWVRPTFELLKRLSNQGFSVRTEDYILVHLTKPVESMTYGEFYFQAGRQLPGRLSLKFNHRRQNDGVHVIQQTTLTPEQESDLASNPIAFLAFLRDQARSAQPDYKSVLTSLILLNNQYERQRVPANDFFQNFVQPVKFLPHANYPRPPMLSSPDSIFLPNFPREALCSFPASSRQVTPANIYGNTVKPRSGSEGLIPQLTFMNADIQRPSRQMGPVENDETKQNSASSSEGSQYVPIKMLNEASTSEELPKAPFNINKTVSKVSNTKEMLTEAYVDTTHGMTGQNNARQDRRESNDSGSGRTNLKSEYFVNAGSSLGHECSTPSDDSDKPSFSSANRRATFDAVQNGGSNFPFTLNTPTSCRYPLSINAWLQTCPSLPYGDGHFRTPMQEQYIGTTQAFGNSPEGNSWTSHQQLDSHAIYEINHPQYGQSYISYNPPGLIYPSMSGQPIMIPLTVEELNQMSEIQQRPRRESQN